MIIRDPDSQGDLTEISPRYGFPITIEMATALDPALDAFDSWEDNPLEYIELAIREEVGLAHTLNYNIEHDFDLPTGIVKEYSRANGVWVPGFVSPDAPQFIACEEEMRRTGNFRESLYFNEAMIDGSLIYEPKDWAVPYILTIWDSKDPFYAFLGWLSMQEPTEEFTVFDPDPNIGNQLAEVVKKLTSRRIRSDEQEEMMVAINLSRGESATAEEILEFFSGRYL
jgi:hypothetical protein